MIKENPSAYILRLCYHIGFLYIYCNRTYCVLNTHISCLYLTINSWSAIIQLLSSQYISLTPIRVHIVFSHCNPLHSKTSQLDSLSSVTFDSILFHCNQLQPFNYKFKTD